MSKTIKTITEFWHREDDGNVLLYRVEYTDGDIHEGVWHPSFAGHEIKKEEKRHAS